MNDRTTGIGADAQISIGRYRYRSNPKNTRKKISGAWYILLILKGCEVNRCLRIKFTWLRVGLRHLGLLCGHRLYLMMTQFHIIN